jgi:hypothetical protein
MTKTEQALIDIARKNGGRCGITTTYGRGAYGGKVQAGLRERNAMLKLEAKGLIKIVDRQPWQDYNRGYCQGGTSFVFVLLDK